MPDTCKYHTKHITEITQIKEMTNTNSDNIKENKEEIKEVKKTHEILIGLKKDMESIKTQMKRQAEESQRNVASIAFFKSGLAAITTL